MSLNRGLIIVILIRYDKEMAGTT